MSDVKRETFINTKLKIVAAIAVFAE